MLPVRMMYLRVWRGSGQGGRVNVSCIFLHLRHEDDATLVYEYDVDLCRTTGHQQLAAKRQWSCRLSWPCRRVSWQKNVQFCRKALGSLYYWNKTNISNMLRMRMRLHDLFQPLRPIKSNQLQLFCLPIASPILEFPLETQVKKYAEITSIW